MPPSRSSVRTQQLFLYVLGAVTFVVVTGWTIWVSYSAGSVWLSRIFGE